MAASILPKTPRAAPVVTLIILLSLPPTLFAGGSDSFALSWERDLTMAAAATGLFIVGRLAEPKDAGQPFGWPDEALVLPYSPDLERAGDLALVLCGVSLPFLLDRVEGGSMLTMGVVFAETALATIGIKDLLKAAFSRPRPYIADPALAGDMAPEEDAYGSFPSGHATLAFMTASFSSYVFSQGEASPGAKWAFGGACFGMAALASTLRVWAGGHYLGDVLGGAILGSLMGVLGPRLHELSADEGTGVNGSPLGMFLSIRY